MATLPESGNPAQPKADSKSPSTMAGKVALVRACESMRPENERICYDSYAIRFLDPTVQQKLAQDPGAYLYIMGQIESMLPGISGAIIARVRCFDEIVRNTVRSGTGQIVILGAGYDTRAYRIKELGQVHVFEVDHPATIRAKKEKIHAIFGALPPNVTYVPADLETEEYGMILEKSGYDPRKKTLFLMEGLIMYLSPGPIDRIFSFMANSSPEGSSVLFDYCPHDDGKHDGSGWEAARRASEFVSIQGEPVKSCIMEPVDRFLSGRGFSGVRNFTGDDLRLAYFQGTNSSCTVCGMYSIAHAFVDRHACTAGDDL